MRRTNRLGALTIAFLAAATALPTAYTLTGPKWGTRTVSFYINPANSDVPEADAEAAIQAGAATWGSQSNADFRFYYMGRTAGSTLSNNGKNEVFFRNTANGSLIAETYWWADSSGRLIDADIVFYDGGNNFATGNNPCNGFYIDDTAAHEFGHALGLGHSSDVNATMYYMQNWCSQNWRTLESDDLAAVEALYPASRVNTAPTVAIASPLSGLSVVQGSAVTFVGSASDQQDGNLTSSVVWTSNLVGQSLGYGGSVTAALPLGTNVVTATVTDSGGYSATAAVTVAVTSASIPSIDLPSSTISLSATGYRLKQGPRVDLTWSGATSASVDIYRNGTRVTTTANDGTQVDSPGRKTTGTVTYKVCDAGTSNCSSTATVTF
jgi:hypothetical protein